MSSGSTPCCPEAQPGCARARACAYVYACVHVCVCARAGALSAAGSLLPVLACLGHQTGSAPGTGKGLQGAPDWELKEH